MGNILTLSGKKQSGKNTSANWLLGLTMCELGIVRDYIHITNKGQLQITDLWGDESFRGIFDYFNPHPSMADFLEEHIHPWFKIYSFADILKRDVCRGLLGLSEKQCFGTDEDKNSLTELKWEDMPGIITPEVFGPVAAQYNESMDDFQKYWNIIVREPGPMTAREVLQFVGTEVFRKMYKNIWVRGTIDRILKENTGLAVIVDGRFPNEVSITQEAGGKVVRFLRHKIEPDDHESETALDPENFDQSKFDVIIENGDMKIGEQNKVLYEHLVTWNYVSEMQSEE